MVFYFSCYLDKLCIFDITNNSELKIMLEILLYLLTGHFIGDFAFQTAWMYAEKGKLWKANFAHAAVYTSVILIVVRIGMGSIPISISALALIAVSHFIIDPLKARWGIIKYFWLDQLLHIAVLITAIFIP